MTTKHIHLTATCKGFFATGPKKLLSSLRIDHNGGVMLAPYMEKSTKCQHFCRSIIVSKNGMGPKTSFPFDLFAKIMFIYFVHLLCEIV